MTSIDDIRAAKEVLSSRLLRTRQNRTSIDIHSFGGRSIMDGAGVINAVGIGRKIFDRRPTEELAVRLYVETKVSSRYLTAAAPHIRYVSDHFGVDATIEIRRRPGAPRVPLPAISPRPAASSPDAQRQYHQS